MANSDYQSTGIGSFCPFVSLSAPAGYDDTELHFVTSNIQPYDEIVEGDAGMLGDEIVAVVSLGDGVLTVRRGCADTTPTKHAVGEICWFFSKATGTNAREYAAGETIGVKPSPFTTGGGTLPVKDIVPLAVTFDWRFFRPYPPARMRVNGERWHAGAAVTEAQPNMRMTWVHRDRVLQANILVGHDDATIGPEPGTTYTLRVYDANAQKVREEVGLVGTEFNYQWPQIVNDFGYPADVRAGYATFTSMRDGVEAYSFYRWDFTVDPAGTLTSQFMDFPVGTLEVPYRQLVVNGLPADGNYVATFAARPSDRMSDQVEYFTPGFSAKTAYTPWATSEYRLPELETTLNVRASSFSDGVLIPQSAVGRIALIDQEIVQVEAVHDTTISIRRGCLDTVPAVHLPGARLWFVEGVGDNLDPNSHPADTIVEVRFRPVVYGPQVPLDEAKVVGQQTFNRSIRPYPPAQLVVNGRPWFEEATAISGNAVAFSWARRNRVTQGAEIYAHAYEDVEPEDGQVTRLTFFYEKPSATPGAAAERVVLRTIESAGTAYDYPYEFALIDGDAAGRDTGVCGTVVVSVSIESVRGEWPSGQRYTTALRLPSYPCN